MHGFGQDHEHPALETEVEVPPYMLEHRQFSDRRHHFVAPFDHSVAPAEGKFISDPAAWYASFGVSWQLNLPLLVGETCFGVLNFWQPSDRPFTEQQIELGYALAQQVTLAIRFSQLAEEAKQAAIAREQEQAARKHSAELTKVNDALRRSVEGVSQSLRLDAILESLLLESMHVVAAAGGGITLWQNGQYAGLQCVAQDGIIVPREQWETEPIFREAPDVIGQDADGFASRLLSAPYTRDTLEAAIEWWPAAAEYHGCRGHVEVWNVPCRLRGELVAHLGLAFREHREHDPVIVDTLTALAQQMSLALEVTRLVEAAREAAIAREQEQAAQERAAEYGKANEALRGAIAGLARLEDLEQFLAEMLRVALDMSGAHSGAVVLIEGDFLRHAVIFDQCGLVDPQTQREHGLLLTPFSPEIRKMAHSILQSPDAWVAHPTDANIPSKFQSFHEEQKTRSIRRVPMQVGDRLLGWIGLGFAEANPPLGKNLGLLQVLAEQMTMAVEMLRLAEEARQTAIAREQEQAAQAQAAELARANSLLRHSLSRLSTNPNLDDILGHLLVELVSYAGASVGHLFIYDAGQEMLKLKARCRDGQAFCTPAADEPALFQAPIPIEKTQIFAQLRSQPRLAVMNQHEFEGRMWQGVMEWFEAKGYRGTSSCILMVGDRPFGMLAMAFAQPIAFRAVEEELILALAQQIALVLQLTLLSEADKQNAIAREQEQAAQERAVELERVNTLLRDSVAQLSQQADVNTFLGQVAGEILYYLNAANIFILRYSPENHTLCLCLFHDGSRLRWGPSGEELAIFAAPFSADITPAFEIMFRERRMFTPSNYSSFISIPIEEFSLPGGLEWMEHINTSDAAITALFAGDTPIGTIHIHFTNGQQMRQEDEAFFLSLTQQAAIALRIADLAEKAKQVAILEERNRMARDIHDTLAQSFTGIILQLETLKGNAPIAPDDIQTRLDRVSNLARLGLAEARRSVQALRPQALETSNVVDALRQLLHQMTHDMPMRATLKVEGIPCLLSPTIEENLLRIGQEALTNAIRHGHAHTLTLQLLFEPTVVHLQIRDDGNGFDPHHITPSGFGLVGMQERALQLNGHFHLISHPGQGTEITVTVPAGA